MYKEDFALDNLQWWYAIKPNQTNIENALRATNLQNHKKRLLSYAHGWYQAVFKKWKRIGYSNTNIKYIVEALVA